MNSTLLLKVFIAIAGGVVIANATQVRAQGLTGKAFAGMDWSSDEILEKVRNAALTSAKTPIDGFGKYWTPAAGGLGAVAIFAIIRGIG